MSGSAKFTLISEEAAPPPETTDELAKANTRMLLLALSALGKRALTAITNLFTLGLVASAWWLWNRILPDPTVLQLVGVGSYAVFCLLIDIVRRRNG
jgi:hypothetical protein